MFAILVDDVLYLKADKDFRLPSRTKAWVPSFIGPTASAPVAMSYWEVPPRLLDAPAELASWAREAHRISRLGKAKSPRRRR